jgi:hypothetical protein
VTIFGFTSYKQNTIVHLHVEFESDPMIRYRMALIRRSPRPPPSIPLVNLVSENVACNSHISLHHVENPPSQLARRGGGSLEWRLGLAHFHNEYSFLMISPKLHDISLFFVLILSPL